MNEILLIEDSPTDQEQAERILREVGVKNPIRCIADGPSAMTYLDFVIAAPSVLLFDLNLPNFDGFQILQKLRERPGFNGTLRIVFSALDNLATIKRCYASGANTFLSKPINSDALRQVIRSFPEYWLIDHIRPYNASCPV